MNHNQDIILGKWLKLPDGDNGLILDDMIVIFKKRNNSLIDYKFHCFQGEPRFLYISKSEMTEDGKNDFLKYLDLNWNPTPFGRPDHPQLTEVIDKPAGFEKMIELSRRLAQDRFFYEQIFILSIIVSIFLN